MLCDHGRDLRYLFDVALISNLDFNGRQYLTIHSNCSDDILSQMLLTYVSTRIAVVVFVIVTYRDLKDELLVTVHRLESIENGRELVGIEFN